MRVTNWGKYPEIETRFESARGVEDATAKVAQAESIIGRGLGRCYGDSALNSKRILSSLRLDKMISFDERTGILVAEAGVSLAETLAAFAPWGWFLPVTPGTKFVTLGGAVASNVHGKNHHVAQCFGNHVLWVDLITSRRGTVRCSPEEEPDLFHATCGGHGLTGFITRVAVRLMRVPSVWIRQESTKAANLTEIMEAFERYEGWTYSVAWIDCLKGGKDLGRSILMCGEFAEPEDLPIKLRSSKFRLPPRKSKSIPLDFPSLALNSFSVKAFNGLYFAKAPKGQSQSMVSYETFFYPLDSVLHWNRIYGKRGFTQYQFVLPKEAGLEGLPRILTRIAAGGLGSFLAVLKLFGRQDRPQGNISFPMEGYTLALDFPITPDLFPLLDELDAMVLDYGGRHYLTKDVRLGAEAFRRGYGKAVQAFSEVKDRWDPKGIFSSLQSQRLGLGE